MPVGIFKAAEDWNCISRMCACSLWEYCSHSNFKYLYCPTDGCAKIEKALKYFHNVCYLIHFKLPFLTIQGDKEKGRQVGVTEFKYQLLIWCYKHIVFWKYTFVVQISLIDLFETIF